MSGFEREMPHDARAEMGVLGSMLLSRDAIEEVLEVVKSPADFYVPKHEYVFEAIAALYRDGKPADALTVASLLERTGQLGKVGGPPYIADLMQAVPSSANAGWYAETVRDKARLRAINTAGMRLQQMAFATDDSDIDEIEAQAQAEVLSLGNGPAATVASSNTDALMGLLDDIENGTTPGVMTGFTDLDELTGGFQPGEMIVMAGRPAMGKSTGALDIHRHVSIKNDECSLMFSLEMTHKIVTRRILSAEARVPLHHLRHGSMTEDDWARVAKHSRSISNAPLFIDDTRGLTVGDIYARARKIARKYPIKLITVDYLQLLHTGKRHTNREQEVAEISRVLRDMASKLGVPVIAVAQLNRGPEMRSDKKPMMSDLRESGSLEQDADMVILLHREAAYVRESPRAGEADWIVAKYRNGPPATITVAFQGHYSRFVDMQKT